MHDVPQFTLKELKHALHKSKKGKAADPQGIVVEMLQSASEKFLEKVLAIFNAVLRADCTPSSHWRHSELKVIFKNGDATLPKNSGICRITLILHDKLRGFICPGSSVLVAAG